MVLAPWVALLLLLSLLARLTVAVPWAPSEAPDGARRDPRRGPCPPCHCSDDILDCTGVDVLSPQSLEPIANWNTSG